MWSEESFTGRRPCIQWTLSGGILSGVFVLDRFPVGMRPREHVRCKYVSAPAGNAVVTCHCCRQHSTVQSATDWQNRYSIDRSLLIYRRTTRMWHRYDLLQIVWPNNWPSRVYVLIISVSQRLNSAISSKLQAAVITEMSPETRKDFKSYNNNNWFEEQQNSPLQIIVMAFMLAACHHQLDVMLSCVVYLMAR